ncbi:hypothetical protein [Pedobacter sp. W3I1]|uniref:hypothetical protein n=1 Tax=Pedobacter sp. W3I1 TaxID=3042291 RepID=UPI0027D7DB6E|nr:hypothetical protein [Pedobacter sp. W3I1]
MFGNTYPAFKDKLQAMVDKGKLNPLINMTYAQESIKQDHRINSPRVNAENRQIMLHESFLSYLWCISYTLYIETIDYPKINKKEKKEVYKINEDEIAKARELFAYGKSLIAFYSVWDKDNLPNPEKYLAEKRNYIEQSNICYTEAMKFILAVSCGSISIIFPS